MKRTSKVQFIEEYSDKFSRALVTILADYRGLKVEEINALRSELRKLPGGEFRVVKNSLCRRLLAGTDKADLADHFVGPVSVYFGYEDPVTPTKKLMEFAKTNKHFEVTAGYYDGRVLSADDVKALSTMPTKPELQSMLLSVLAGPPRNLVNLLANVPRGLLNVLNAHKANLEDAA